MKKIIASLLTLTFLLSGCSIFKLRPTENSDKENEITSFDISTDAMMVDDTSSGGDSFKLLTMYVGETYQIKTSVDEKIGDDYYFTYSDYNDQILTVSNTGLVTGVSKGVESVDVKLFRTKDSKKIATKYFIANIKDPTSEYANISINDSTLDYNEATRTYSLTLKGGDSYHINTRVSYNVLHNKVFELADPSYASFMSVNADGDVTTQRVSEDKDGRVVIKTTNQSGTHVYDTIYLDVHIQKNDDVVTNELVVTNLSTGSTLNNGDSLSMYVGESLTFGVTYGGSNKYNVSTVSNSSVLTLDNALNKITAIATGSSDVTFSYEGQSLTIHVTILPNSLTEIYAKNGADDFVIINGSLRFLGRVFARYASGLEEDITNNANLTNSIQDLNATHKKVTFSFSDGGVTKTVIYNVRFFVGNEYSPNDTYYNFSDYFTNYLRGNYYALRKDRAVHMLVIPIWFTNSTNFFRENQKDEIITDLEYVFNTIREDGNYYSVKQFYQLESNGQVIINSTISDFYECGHASTHYGDTVNADIVATHNLADSAITWYFNNHPLESISDYDTNGDNKVDAVSLVYGATYYGTIGDQNGTTAFQFKDTILSENHKYNNGSFSPLGGIYGFKKNSSSTTLPKDTAVTDLSAYYPPYYFNSGSKTIIHETAHMFGFDDLYEDNHASVKYSPAGKFSMQDSDNGGHDPYQMNLVGWSKPQIYDASAYSVGSKVTLTISDFASSGNNILLTREMNANHSLFDEYMLLELLAPNGVNKFDATQTGSAYKFSEPGIRLWHVDSILGDMFNGNADTTEISNSTWVQLKYSNYDQSSKYDLAHWIRNNEDEPYDTTSTVANGYGLFKTGDSFDMATYQSQFVNPGLLDNKEKLGWEFSVDTIYKTVDDDYGAVITLTRVDNTRTEFDFETRINKDIGTDNQPTVDGTDYATLLFGSDELFSLIYNFNDSTEPSFYNQSWPISNNGLCLFASNNGNGGSIVISIKDKAGYTVRINSISITYTMLTNASVSVIVDGQSIEGTSFTTTTEDVLNNELYEAGITYDVNSKSATIQNTYTGGTNHYSVFGIYSLFIEYHMEQI